MFNRERVGKLLNAILNSRLMWKTSPGATTTGRRPSREQRRKSWSKTANVDELTLSITDEIRASVRDLQFDRYRLVVIVSIGDVSVGGTDVLFASRCLWNPDVDAFAEATIRTPILYAVAVVFAVYLE